MSSKRGPTRLVVFVSSTGSGMQVLLHAYTGFFYRTWVVAVDADHRGAPAIRTAEEAGVSTLVRVLSEHSLREGRDESLHDAVVAYKPDIVVLTGFLKPVDPGLLAMLPRRVTNTHNALLSSLPGAHDPADVLAYGVEIAGATLFVVNPGMSTGPILEQTTCSTLEGDFEEALVERIKEAERTQLVELIGRVAREG